MNSLRSCSKADAFFPVTLQISARQRETIRDINLKGRIRCYLLMTVQNAGLGVGEGEQDKEKISLFFFNAYYAVCRSYVVRVRALQSVSSLHA